MYTAHEIASESNLYNKPIYFGTSFFAWECMGYSRSGNSVHFARLEVLPNGKIRQVDKYVHPDKPVSINPPSNDSPRMILSPIAAALGMEPGATQAQIVERCKHLVSRSHE